MKLKQNSLKTAGLQPFQNCFVSILYQCTDSFTDCSFTCATTKKTLKGALCMETQRSQRTIIAYVRILETAESSAFNY